MRYISIDTVTFTDESGNKTSVKDLRPIETLTTLKTIKVENNAMLDQIANRNDIYGQNSENQIYKIFDHNIIKLTENNFDLSQLKELKIPV